LTATLAPLRTDYAIRCSHPDHGSGSGGISSISEHSTCPASTLLKKQAAVRYFAMDRSGTNCNAKRNGDGNIRDY